MDHDRGSLLMTDSPPHSLSISAVLPAYNEEASIEQTIRRVAEVLDRLADTHEIIVTDDGSRDGTGEILASLQEQAPDLCLRAVTHEVNRGYGAALASGFDAAGCDLIFLTDSDQQFDPAELGSLMEAMQAHIDMVIGWRRNRADSRMRLLNAWGWKQLINGLFGYTARDVDCAFKLIRRKVWESVSVDARGATFSAELLVRARYAGFTTVERPVSHFPRTAGSATGARLDVILRAFTELFALWQELRIQPVSQRRSRSVPSEISG
jgi:glycosyltransferase involved in cell wall biosynthesis